MKRNLSLFLLYLVFWFGENTAWGTDVSCTAIGLGGCNVDKQCTVVTKSVVAGYSGPVCIGGHYTCKKDPVTGKELPGWLLIKCDGYEALFQQKTCGQTAAPVCGDGVKEGNEECDDGNTKDGDGCSSNCKIEHATCPAGFGESACSKAQCEDKVEIKSKYDSSDSKTCYKCTEPKPCENIGPNKLATQEGDPQCEESCTKRVDNPTWNCPGASSPDSVVRNPTDSFAHCCKYNEGAITDKCAAKKQKCSVPTKDTCTDCVLATDKEKCDEGSTHIAKEYSCIDGTPCPAYCGCNT